MRHADNRRMGRKTPRPDIGRASRCLNSIKLLRRAIKRCSPSKGPLASVAVGAGCIKIILGEGDGPTDPHSMCRNSKEDVAEAN
ncbi:hypothetical protein BJY04DRAFT_181800 [Aspergillus karnatakaensis]|uniref:uncharacterized protein n=1 Tax=Aspergillus karnatakaensis TaxID=1810916 RepID=UPI003CCE08F4